MKAVSHDVMFIQRLSSFHLGICHCVALIRFIGQMFTAPRRTVQWGVLTRTSPEQCLCNRFTENRPIVARKCARFAGAMTQQHVYLKIKSNDDTGLHSQSGRVASWRLLRNAGWGWECTYCCCRPMSIASQAGIDAPFVNLVLHDAQHLCVAFATQRESGCERCSDK